MTLPWSDMIETSRSLQVYLYQITYFCVNKCLLQNSQPFINKVVTNRSVYDRTFSLQPDVLLSVLLSK